MKQFIQQVLKDKTGSYSMRELVIGARQEDHLVATAFEVALRNHNAVSVRRHFAQLMREIC